MKEKSLIRKTIQKLCGDTFFSLNDLILFYQQRLEGPRIILSFTSFPSRDISVVKPLNNTFDNITRNWSFVPKKETPAWKTFALFDFVIYSWVKLLQKFISGPLISSLYQILHLSFRQLTRHLMQGYETEEFSSTQSRTGLSWIFAIMPLQVVIVTFTYQENLYRFG